MQRRRHRRVITAVDARRQHRLARRRAVAAPSAPSAAAAALLLDPVHAGLPRGEEGREEAPDHRQREDVASSRAVTFCASMKRKTPRLQRQREALDALRIANVGREPRDGAQHGGAHRRAGGARAAPSASTGRRLAHRPSLCMLCATSARPDPRSRGRAAARARGRRRRRAGPSSPRRGRPTPRRRPLVHRHDQAGGVADLSRRARPIVSPRGATTPGRWTPPDAARSRPRPRRRRVMV